MKYVILGGGPAGIFAAEAIRRRDAASPVVMVTEEEEVARSPVLLTYWVGGQVPGQGVRFRDPSWEERNRVDLRLGRKAIAVKTSSRTFFLATGEEIPYDRLLIATGASPISLPVPGAGLEGVLAIRHMRHAQAILNALPALRQVIIIGGGFIGLKIAGHLKERGIEVAVLEKESRLAPRMLDDRSSGLVADFLGRKGIRVETGVEVEEILGKEERVCAVRLKDGRVLLAQIVIQAVGVKPNTDFLAGSGIALEEGIPVPPLMETNLPDVFAAGDVALTLDSITGDRINNATWPAASRQGAVAGANMAGGDVSYVHNLPLNALSLCGIPIMAAGRSADMGGEGLAEDGPGFYRKIVLQDGRITGFILIGRVSRAGILLAWMKKKEVRSRADLMQESFLCRKPLPPGYGYGHGRFAG